MDEIVKNAIQAVERRSVRWCTHPDCAAVAHYERCGEFGWHYDCPVHARQAEAYGYVVTPIAMSPDS